MKNNVLAFSVLSLTLASSAAMANSGNLQFIGSVSAKTCDVATDIGGVTGNVLQLGTVAAGTAGTAVPFTLKLKDAANCDLTSLTNADITFDSANLSTTGLANSSGTSTGAWVKLTSVNAVTPGDITSSNRTATVTTANMKATGATFTAQLTGGTTAGTYTTEVSYAIAYK